MTAYLMDSSGNAYVTGATYSSNFPTASPIYGTNSGYQDGFVTKINAYGNGLVYSTYLGGNGWDYGFSIAVDASGQAYVTGGTTSTNFPTAAPIYGSNAGNGDAFMTVIGNAGTNLVFSTYLGGIDDDWGNDIAVDTTGGSYITGATTSINFPTASAIDRTLNGIRDAFVAKIK